MAISLPIHSEAAIADGTYSLNYQVNQPGSNSASMANDYFLKPAKLVVKNGKMTMQITIKNSSWVTQFNPPGGAKVIASNESADQRTVLFSVADANIITIAMKIDIDDIDYHHAYSVDFVFDRAGLPEAPVEEPKEEPKQETPSVQQQPAQPAAPVEPPKSSSGSNTSSNKPATSTDSNVTTTESSQQTQATKDDSIKTEQNTTDTEQAEQSEVVENPETSDELPLLAVLVFIIAAIVFVRTKQTKTNG